MENLLTYYEIIKTLKVSKRRNENNKCTTKLRNQYGRKKGFQKEKKTGQQTTKKKILKPQKYENEKLKTIQNKNRNRESIK